MVFLCLLLNVGFIFATSGPGTDGGMALITDFTGQFTAQQTANENLKTTTSNGDIIQQIIEGAINLVQGLVNLPVLIYHFLTLMFGIVGLGFTHALTRGNIYESLFWGLLSIIGIIIDLSVIKRIWDTVVGQRSDT